MPGIARTTRGVIQHGQQRSLSPFTGDGGHDGGVGGDASGGMAAQSKRKVWGQEAMPTTRSNEQAEAVERGNT